MKSNSSLLGTGLLVFGLGLVGLSAVWLVLHPKVYEASTRLTVEKSESDVGSFTNFSKVPYDPYWLQTEFERIQSKRVLFQVISNLDLSHCWAAKGPAAEALSLNDAYVLLKGRMDVGQARGTSLITITVRSEDPAESARIANETARVYGETRLQERRQLMGQGMVTLEEEVLQVEEQIKEKQKAIAGAAEGGVDATGASEARRELQSLEQTRDQLRLRMEREKVDLAMAQSSVRVVEPAEPPSRPSCSNHRCVAYGGLWVGMALSVLGGFLLSRR